MTNKMLSIGKKFPASYTKNDREIRKIFGKNVEIICNDEDLRASLLQELSIYPEMLHNKNQIVDYTLELITIAQMEQRRNEFNENNYIQLQSKSANRYFIFEGGILSRILFSLNKPINEVHGWIQRFRNMGYNRREERIGEIIHEQVLVPSVIFDSNVIPVHSSAVKYNGDVILFGGHGGVGKTSLELELCFHKGAHFIADDISVISLDGKVYPNLSYPKIYGYNVEGQPKIKKRIFDSFDALETLHWKLHKAKGLDKVRRRMAPSELYDNYLNVRSSGDRYIILTRYGGEEIMREIISSEKASDISIKILKTEFSKVFRKLKVLNKAGLEELNSEAIINRWQRDLPAALSTFECEIVYIPKSISHNNFKKKMLEIFS